MICLGIYEEWKNWQKVKKEANKLLRVTRPMIKTGKEFFEAKRKHLEAVEAFRQYSNGLN